jgi:hypothetical protein
MAAPNFLIRLPPTESQQIPQTQELSKQALRPILAKLTDYLLPGLLIITALVSVAWFAFLVWAVFHFIVGAIS